MLNLSSRPGFSPLKETEYRYYLTGRFFYTMSLRMVTTVIAYKLFQLTKSSFSIGLVGMSEFIPVFLLALYAGHRIDRTDKRTVLLNCKLSYAACVCALILLTSSYFENRLNKGWLEFLFYLVIFFTGIIRAFAGPTSSSLVAQLVSKNVLHYAVNLSSSAFLGASILGHASAGFFIAWFGVNTTFCIILIYVLIAAFMVRKIGRKPAVSTSMDKKTWESVKEGLHFVFNNKILLGAISLDLFAVLFGGAIALIPEFAERILKVGPIGFGWLNASMDIGAVIMIILLSIFPIQKNQGRTLMFAVAGFGTCIIVFGLSNIYAISFIALLIAGLLDGISVIIRGTILQLTTPDEMRGRVSSVNAIFINSSNELGQFESGFTSRIMGTVPAVLFGGVMTVIVVIVMWFKAPPFVRWNTDS
ncbi:MAG TPA: MFS transporter [Parasegetibacter sp.]